MLNKQFGIALLSFVFIVSNTYAQSDYALLANGDTLRGELKYSLFENLDRLQIQSNGKKTNYTALQVKGFSKDGEKYQSIKYDKAYRFMKVIKSGYLSLLAFNTTLSVSWDGQYLKKIDDGGMEVPNLGFKKFVSNYLSDCPTIQSKFEKGEFKKSELNNIIDFYNACIEAKSSTLGTKKVSTANSEKNHSLNELIASVQADEFLTKKDALDVLNEIQNKISKNEVIPNFLFESLKSYLLDKPDLLKKAEDLILQLKK
jgi:hypothetical protein